ncbi:MAG TPA: DNA repair exonuclease [Acidimicrobiales bacterium]|nr:DNA repair exonuclease [Acidimicrobiales bacterium]
MVRFLHTADLQLGMTRRYLTAEEQPRFTQARIEAVRALGRLAAAEGCQFVVVCGDVFEANQVDRRVVARTLEALADVPVPVYLLPGNHDPLDAGSVLTSPAFAARQPPNVTVLAQAVPLSVAPGVELVAAPWTSKRPLADLVGQAAAALPADGTTRIVVGHGAVDVLSPDRDNPALISVAPLEAALAAARIHYVALGDRHSTTAVGGTGRIWYSGAPEATDFDEVDPGNVLVVDLGDGSANVTRHHIGRWAFVRQAFTLDGPADVDALASWLQDLPAKDETVLRLDLAGLLTLREQARLDQVLAAAADRFAALDVWGAGMVVAPDADDQSTLGLSGFAQHALEALEAEAVGADPAVAAEAQAALGLLYRLARGAA